MRKTVRALSLALLVLPAASLAAKSDEVDALRRASRDFDARCASCHSLGAGVLVGPDLAGVSVRRSAEWLSRWLSSPEWMLQTDAQARALLSEYGTRMPDPKLSDEDVGRFIRYFRWFDARPAASRH